MNIFQTAMKTVGNFLGSSVTSGLQAASSYLPSGAQSFLSSVGSTTGITAQSIGDFISDAFTGQLDLITQPTQFGDLPSVPGIGGVGPSGAKQLARAGQAQLIPFGSSDRISRALQDPRVSEKIIKISGGRIPAPNIRGGSTIGLSSAKSPSAALSRKYTSSKVKA